MAGTNRELPEPMNYGRYLWPLILAGVAYSAAAARAQSGYAPLAFAGIAAYAVNKAMVNQTDYISVAVGGGRDFIPF